MKLHNLLHIHLLFLFFTITLVMLAKYSFSNTHSLYQALTLTSTNITTNNTVFYRLQRLYHIMSISSLTATTSTKRHINSYNSLTTHSHQHNVRSLSSKSLSDPKNTYYISICTFNILAPCYKRVGTRR